MFLLVSGGSGSGKSAYAEGRVLGFGPARRIYIATMQAFGEEGRARVERHRKLRSGKGFITVERTLNLADLVLDEAIREEKVLAEEKSILSETVDAESTTVLLECMSNLAANEMFDPAGESEQMFGNIERGIDSLLKQCDNLVVVTNEVFSDGILYDPETVRYCEELGRINQMLAAKADEVVEVVCGIPLVHKDKTNGEVR